MILNKVAIAIALAAILAPATDSARAHSLPAAETKVRRVAVDQVIKSEMDARGIPGLQLTIVRHNKIALSAAYGVTNIETARPVDKDTVFGVNSMSKAFAGVAAMQLVEAGKLDLDAPLTHYLDDLPPSWAGISVRHAMTHMSGLPEIVDDNLRLIDGAAPDVAWTKVQALPVDFAPGTRFDYTQTNYVVLGKIVEKLSGKSFAAFVRGGQFNTVKMRRTRFADTPSTAAKSKAEHASLYTYLTLLTEGTKTIGVERSAVPLARVEPWTDMLLPAGGIQTTSTDLAKWVIAVQKPSMVSKSGLAQLWKPQPLSDGTLRGFNAMVNGYGLGWPSARREKHPAITLIGGERAAIFIYPEDDLTIIVLTNLLGASPQKFVDKIAAAYLPGFTVEN